MKITISCSMKYRDLIRQTVSALSRLGITTFFPNLDSGSEKNDVVLSMEEKRRLASDHYAKIDESDILYILTPSGYMGTSCKLELGYALAKKKLIYFSEPTNDTGLDCCVHGFIPSDKLERFLEVSVT